MKCFSPESRQQEVTEEREGICHGYYNVRQAGRFVTPSLWIQTSFSCRRAGCADRCTGWRTGGWRWLSQQRPDLLNCSCHVHTGEMNHKPVRTENSLRSLFPHRVNRTVQRHTSWWHKIDRSIRNLGKKPAELYREFRHWQQINMYMGWCRDFSRHMVTITTLADIIAM